MTKPTKSNYNSNFTEVMNANLAVKEQSSIDQLSQEAMQILELLDQIESHTADLRKKLMAELRAKNNAVRIQLEEV